MFVLVWQVFAISSVHLGRCPNHLIKQVVFVLQMQLHSICCNTWVNRGMRKQKANDSSYITVSAYNPTENKNSIQLYYLGKTKWIFIESEMSIINSKQIPNLSHLYLQNSFLKHWTFYYFASFLDPPSSPRVVYGRVWKEINVDLDVGIKELTDIDGYIDVDFKIFSPRLHRE
jgi:hypothetical protein